MRDHEDKIRAAGGSIAAVGTGDADYGRAFRDATGVGFPLLVDPELRSYRMVGARRGSVSDGVRPTVLASGLRALRRGSRQSRPGPHPLTLGATHVIGPDGDVVYGWIDGDYADTAPLPDVLAALRSC